MAGILRGCFVVITSLLLSLQHFIIISIIIHNDYYVVLTVTGPCPFIIPNK